MREEDVTVQESLEFLVVLRFQVGSSTECIGKRSKLACRGCQPAVEEIDNSDRLGMRPIRRVWTIARVWFWSIVHCHKEQNLWSITPHGSQRRQLHSVLGCTRLS